MDIKGEIRNFIQSNFIGSDDPLAIEDDENIFESGFVDSSFAMQLVVFIEESFDIQIADDDLDLVNFTTINRIVQFINKKKVVEY